MDEIDWLASRGDESRRQVRISIYWSVHPSVSHIPKKTVAVRNEISLFFLDFDLKKAKYYILKALGVNR